jgi:hypothetical protein
VVVSLRNGTLSPGTTVWRRVFVRDPTKKSNTAVNALQSTPRHRFTVSKLKVPRGGMNGAAVARQRLFRMRGAVATLQLHGAVTVVAGSAATQRAAYDNGETSGWVGCGVSKLGTRETWQAHPSWGPGSRHPKRRHPRRKRKGHDRPCQWLAIMLGGVLLAAIARGAAFRRRGRGRWRAHAKAKAFRACRTQQARGSATTDLVNILRYIHVSTKLKHLD